MDQEVKDRDIDQDRDKDRDNAENGGTQDAEEAGKSGKVKGKQQNYTYMLRCGDGSYYTGWTNNLVRRLHMHQTGKGGKYTCSHLPVHLVYFEVYDNPHDARTREPAIKRLKRPAKEALVQSFPEETLTSFLHDYETAYCSGSKTSGTSSAPSAQESPKSTDSSDPSASADSPDSPASSSAAAKAKPAKGTARPAGKPKRAK